MEERNLVPQQPEADVLRERLTYTLNEILAERFNALRLSDLYYDDLILALQKIYKTLQTLAVKYKELEQCKLSLNVAKKEAEDALDVSNYTSLLILLISVIVVIFGRWWMGIIAFLISCIFMEFVGNVIFEPTQAMRNKSEKIRLEKVIPAEAKLHEVKNELNEILNSNIIDLASRSLGEEYLNFDAIGLFIKYLQRGRADNIKEAINLYEEELHRRRVEAMQQTTIEATKQVVENTAESSEILKDIKNILKS